MVVKVDSTEPTLQDEPAGYEQHYARYAVDLKVVEPKGPSGWPIVEVTGDEGDVLQYLVDHGYGAGDYEVVGN